MAMLDEKFQLIYKMNSGEKILINEELVEKLQNAELSSFKIKSRDVTFYEIIFENDDSLFIFNDPVKCKITISNSQKVIPLYSLYHLRLLLKNLKDQYKNPYFYSVMSNKIISVFDTSLGEKDFSYERNIDIRDIEEESYEIEIEKIFHELKKIYSNSAYTYEFISPNFNMYFSNINQDKLKDRFKFYFSAKRNSLVCKFYQFLNNKKENSEMIYPICGPHNIGKTITSFIIQKNCFLNGIKSLYLNLKYFFAEPYADINKKINTLIKECFFFINNEKELLELYKKFKNIMQIQDVLQILKNKLESINFEKNNFFLIFD